MKNIKLAIIGIVCLTLFGYIQGCSNNTTEIEQIPNLEIPEEYAEVGKLHNEGLDYIFEELKAAAIEYNKNPKLKGNAYVENRKEIIKQASLKFCKQNKKLQSNFDLCKNVIDITANNKIPLKSGTTYPAVEQLLDEMEIIIGENMERNDLPYLKAQLDVINRKAANTLSEQDAVVIYCATSTAYASYQYWMENYRKWYFVMHYPEILEQYNNEELNQLQLENSQIKTKGWLDNLWEAVENWWSSTTTTVTDWWNEVGRSIVTGDLTGAAVGATTGFLIGSTVGASGATMTIGAIGGAIYYSALAGAGDIFN